LTEKRVCCGKSTHAQDICGQHINSMSVGPSSEDYLMTPALAS